MIASVSANPSHWMLVISSRISGWRVTDSITLPKMMPMPTPAPTAPSPPPTPIPKPADSPEEDEEEAARAKTCASTWEAPCFQLVVRDGATEVDGGKGREDESLEGRDQPEFEEIDENGEGQREPAQEREPQDHGQPSGHEEDDHVTGEDV